MANSVPQATSEVYVEDFTQLATWNATYKTPACLTAQSECDTGNLVYGRGNTWPSEINTPNTINATCADGALFDNQNEAVTALRVRSSSGGPLVMGGTAIIQATVRTELTGSATGVVDLWQAANASNPSWVLIGTFTPPGSGQKVMTASYTLPAGPLQAVRAVPLRGQRQPVHGRLVQRPRRPGVRRRAVR